MIKWNRLPLWERQELHGKVRLHLSANFSVNEAEPVLTYVTLEGENPSTGDVMRASETFAKALAEQVAGNE